MLFGDNRKVDNVTGRVIESRGHSTYFEIWASRNWYCVLLILAAGSRRASALATTDDRVFRRRNCATAPTVIALATPTNAFARPTALERRAAFQATAYLGDEGSLWCRLRDLFHVTRLPRHGTV